MNENIEVIGLNTIEKRYYDVKIPDSCPYCCRATNLKRIGAYYIKHPEKSNVIFVLYSCATCENIIIYKYGLVYSNVYKDYTNQTILQEVIPKPSLNATFKDIIKELSPKFCQIYNEAYLAEQQELFEICGIGYRKALEFIVKDFAIFQHPNKSDSIKNISLSNCIETYIGSNKIKALAKASTWLGNDETHYVRKHEDYSLEDLKSFINATVSFIEMELEVIKAYKLLKK